MPAVDLAFDLEWRAGGPVFPYTETTRYEQAAWVQGEVTIGGEHLEVYCPGQRDHSWGNRVWSFPWLWCSGHLPGSTSFHAVRTLVPGGSNFQTGFVVEPGHDLRTVDRVDVAYTVDEHELPTAATLTIGSLELAVTPELHAPVMIQSPDGVASRFPRSLVPVRERPTAAVGPRLARVQLPRRRPPRGGHARRSTPQSVGRLLGYGPQMTKQLRSRQRAGEVEEGFGLGDRRDGPAGGRAQLDRFLHELDVRGLAVARVVFDARCAGARRARAPRAPCRGA